MAQVVECFPSKCKALSSNSNTTKIIITIIITDKEGLYIRIDELVPQEDITILNMYAPNNSLSRYVKQN
jgi:hypothetical protein